MTKDTNYFCRVEFLDGSTRIYQFPNDLKTAMIEEGVRRVRKSLKDYLINVPVSKYRGKKVKLSVGKIKQVFTMKKTYSGHQRTRGQFISSDTLNSRASVNFLLHDYSFYNKCRIRWQVFQWKMRR